MKQYEVYDAILDLILDKANTTANNIKHFLPDFPEKDLARIELMLDDMYNLAPKAFNRKSIRGTNIMLIRTSFTHILKEDGGFRPYLEAREAKRPIQKVVFQTSTDGDPLKDLHPQVRAAASELFRNGHFADAIFRAYTALNIAVKQKTGLKADNTPLMQSAFSFKNPYLIVGDNEDEQQGFMFLFAGAMLGIRNPKAHLNVEQNDPQRTLEWLSFASVLFRILDESQPNPNRTA
ncbi:TIGR02391 family protein [Spirosoma foliorum]|uniref:TIGR02391 family protein n=1 Tax=Spirosoma foliorum TaxID=2710596 RepID=A0A7G5GTT7_9BACT|nr:TIGR02391 family protein [Spirosoma foliorum]QMW02279.1 TIGR02391 family protein [Spirosoma foliorum]